MILFVARREMGDLAGLSQDPFISDLAGILESLDFVLDGVIEGDVVVSESFELQLEVRS
jgi:hypothetical protein